MSSFTSQRSRASKVFCGSNPISDQEALTDAFDGLQFHKIIVTLLPLRGPAHTYHTITFFLPQLITGHMFEKFKLPYLFIHRYI